jgi:predicted SAM-dependent methyltransferase
VAPEIISGDRTAAGKVSVGVKLNVGCGPVQPAGWINVDGSMRAWLVARLPRLDRALVRLGVLPVTDFENVTFERLERRWRWRDGSVDAIYAGELLEHFAAESGRAFLAECFRVLKPGGILRIRVPDNARFWRNYLAEYEAARQRPQADWTADHSRWVEMFFRDICVRRRWLGSFGHFHKWAYDEVSLIKALEGTGFEQVRRRDYLDSAIADVRAVEVRDDLIVEAVRPSAPPAPARWR